MLRSPAEERIIMEMRCIRNLVDDAGDRTDPIVGNIDGLPQGRGGAEVFGSKGLGDDEAIGPGKGRMDIALEEGDGKDIEEIAVRIDHIGFRLWGLYDHRR